MGCTNSKAAGQNASSTNQSLEGLVSESPASLVKPKAELPKASQSAEPTTTKSSTTSTLASLAAAIPSISLKTQTIYSEVAIGAAMLCRDSFHSKYSGELMYKWRKAEIVNVEGNDKAKVLIHFVGWADTFDQWIDLNTEMDKIAPISLLSKAQCDNGGAMDEEQLKTTRTYLTTGKFIPSSISTDSTSPTAATSSTNGKTLKRAISGQSSQSFNAATAEYRAGQLLDVLDIFYPVGSEIPKSKWRKAKVLNVSGRLLRINYIGWDSKFDENLDVVVDCDRISPVGTKTTEQTSRQITENKKKSPKPTTKQDKARNGIAFGDITSDLRKLGKSIVGGSRKNKDGNSNTNGQQNGESINGTSSHDEGNGEANEEETIEVNENFEEETDDAIARSAEAVQAEIEKERRFIEALARNGLHVIEIEGDGNCLFRAVSHQLHLNEDQHEALRRQCVEHLVYHKKRFSLFCTEDFEEHVKEMSKVGTWGDELEIRALEEIIDRTIRIYSSESLVVDTPITNFEEENLLKGVTPIYLAYHGLNHYNSLYCESNPFPLSLRPSRVLLQARIALFEESNRPKSAAPTTQRQTSNGATSKMSAIAEQQQLLLQQAQQQQQQQQQNSSSPYRDPPVASHPVHSGQMIYSAGPVRGYSNNAMESRRPSLGAQQMSGHQLGLSAGVIDPSMNRAGVPYGRGPSFGGTGAAGIPPSYR